MLRIWVNFGAKSINEFYNLEPVDNRAFDSLYAALNYPKVIKVLTNGHGEWKINSEGHAVHFKAKHLAYIPKVWHHFITSRLIPTTNVCEVKAKRALLNYAIIQDIPFDVGQVIKDSILHNKDAKMNLGHPFLIYSLCKQAEVPFVKTLENSTFLKNGKMVILVKILNFSISQMMKQTSPLESSCEI